MDELQAVRDQLRRVTATQQDLDVVQQDLATERRLKLKAERMAQVENARAARLETERNSLQAQLDKVEKELEAHVQDRASSEALLRAQREESLLLQQPLQDEIKTLSLRLEVSFLTRSHPLSLSLSL